MSTEPEPDNETAAAKVLPPGDYAAMVASLETQAPDTLTEAYEAQGKILREKILFGLNIYPALSPSMLHVFLGTATPKALWKDLVLTALIEEGVVAKTEVTLTSPHDRTQTYTILHLTDKPYTKPAYTLDEQEQDTIAAAS